jgi:8-oxo-dGTP pyrophosphatase MutT (NUDIX family)
VLLALKKRGFGVGKWNGVGGKVETGESVEVAAIREVGEEVGVRVAQGALTRAALLTFRWDAEPSWDCVVHVFLVHDWDGVPVESEEVRPAWFPTAELPFESMWEDDIHWLPRVLKGEWVDAECWFGADGAIRRMRNMD